MTLSRQVVVPGMMAEYSTFSQLVGPLAPDQWRTPTRCGSWTAADVAAHVVGQLADVVALRLDGLGSPEATSRQVEERRGRDPEALVAELEASLAVAGALAASFDDDGWNAPPPGGSAGSVGFGLESLWFDTYIHGDDIRAALGMASIPRPGTTVSLSHVAQVLTDQGWGPAELALDDEEVVAVSGGGGRLVTGDPLAFVLAATGRGDPTPFGLDETVNIYR